MRSYEFEAQTYGFRAQPLELAGWTALEDLAAGPPAGPGLEGVFLWGFVVYACCEGEGEGCDKGTEEGRGEIEGVGWELSLNQFTAEGGI